MSNYTTKQCSLINQVCQEKKSSLIVTTEASDSQHW